MIHSRLGLRGPQRRTVTVRHDQDGDFVQPGILYREVLTEDARERLVANIAGHASNGVTPLVLAQVFQYWSNVDPEFGKRVEEATLANLAASEPATGAGAVPEGDRAARAK